MIEFLSIACIAAVLNQGGCTPDDLNLQGKNSAPVPDSYEQMIAPGMYQLSYAGSGHQFDTAALSAYWNRRASQLCGGPFDGQPVTQTQYPQSGYDAMISSTFLSRTRSFNVEAYGVARCSG